MSPVDDDQNTSVETPPSFEDLLTELSARFVNLPADRVDVQIEASQRLICERLRLDRSALWQLDGENRDRLLLSHHAPTAPSMPVGTDGIQAFPWLAKRILSGEVVALSALDDLPAEAALDRHRLGEIGTLSTVLVPLSVGSSVFGCLTFAATREERAWPPTLVRRFRLVAQVFANALERKRADQALRWALEESQRLRDQLKQENLYLRHEFKGLHGQGIFGQSEAIRRALAQAEQVASTGSTVLLLGETGSGKERFAAHIHELSPRRERPMVRVNCSAIPDALIESELFGREKGAYTGALSRQIGRFELADRSTIFLDEIGDLPADTQMKLLRVLEDRRIERLGSPRSVAVDVRIIAATNQNLEKAVRDGTFRQDLYYRLNVFPLTVPPLRERSEDIPVLVRSFVEEFAAVMGKRIESVPKTDMDALVRYPWPGNVRELRNVIERAMILTSGPVLRVDLPVVTGASRVDDRLEAVECEHIQRVLGRTGWRVRGTGGAAEVLGMKPSTLESRMKKLGIIRPQP